MAWFKENFPNKKIRRRIYLLISFLLLALIIAWQSPPDQVMVKAGTCLLKVEIADTALRQYQGLSNRSELCTNCGMLFLFSQKEHRDFVMHNMNFPLDIIFIADKKIINIHKQAKPSPQSSEKVYSSAGRADAVLEINGGQADRCRLMVGDLISWSK